MAAEFGSGERMDAHRTGIKSVIDATLAEVERLEAGGEGGLGEPTCAATRGRLVDTFFARLVNLSHPPAAPLLGSDDVEKAQSSPAVGDDMPRGGRKDADRVQADGVLPHAEKANAEVSARAAAAARERRVVIVSNRLPVTILSDATLVASGGGLATGLSGPHERSGGLWIGWSGSMKDMDEAGRAKLESQLHARRLLGVSLSDAEIRDYYERVANGVLWPLFHYLIDKLPVEGCPWPAYVAANRVFADAVVERYTEGDLVWIHDYQLMLVPAMVRERLPRARIGFFLHIPFPSVEVFRLLPWREEILRGILGADVIGFHTLSYLRQFVNCLIHVLGKWPLLDCVRVNGRSVCLGAFPMGVDAAAFGRFAVDPGTTAAAARLRSGLPEGGVLVVGIDRLDYTKGVPRRLLAIERLLETHPELRGGRLRFLQVAVPSREAVPQYEVFTADVFRLVGRINGRFSTADAVPVHFLHQSFSQKELVSFYAAADVMLVTPLRDGMNLVAKEFVAASLEGSDRGMLVLSEFAGCAAEMGDALLVNPYDVDGMAAAVHRAITMSPSERSDRMSALRAGVQSNTVHVWADSFLARLAEGPATASTAVPLPWSATLARVAASPAVTWLLDYDGTLRDITSRPGLAAPSQELLLLLRALAGTANGSVHIVSGRSRVDVERWLGALPIGLHAEHGAWSRAAPAPGADAPPPWVCNTTPSLPWTEGVRAILATFVQRVPGSFIEEKTSSIAWHYRMADSEQGLRESNELRLHLSHILSGMPVKIQLGSFVIELVPAGVGKDMVGQRVQQEAVPGTLFVAAGDDDTDDALFRVLPADGVTIAVGSRPSAARFTVQEPASLLALLSAVVRADAAARA